MNRKDVEKAYEDALSQQFAGQSVKYLEMLCNKEKLERLRDEFAMFALAGFLANPESRHIDLSMCYKKADEALIAREIKYEQI